MPYEVRGPMDCHIWTGYCLPDGTPVIRTRTSCTTARRYYYERENGPLPNDVELKALCGESLCVRPRHHIEQPAGTALGDSRRRLDARRVDRARYLAGIGWSNRRIAKVLCVGEGTVRDALGRRERRKNDAKQAKENQHARSGAARARREEAKA